MADLPDVPLPAGIRSRYVDGINGLRMHVLEAGFETKGRPGIHHSIFSRTTVPEPDGFSAVRAGRLPNA